MERACKGWIERLLLAWAVLLWLVPLAAFSQSSNTVNVIWNLTDFIGDPQIVQRLVLRPLDPSIGVGINGTNILAPTRNSRPTGLTGSVEISNVVTGYPYLVQLMNQADPSLVVGSWTNYFPAGLTGTVNGNLYVGQGSTSATGGFTFTFMQVHGTNEPMLEDTSTGIYHEIEAYNDHGIDVLQIADSGQLPGLLTVTWDLTDFIGDPQAVQRLILEPVVPYAGVGVWQTNLLVPARNTRPTGLTGSVTISNVAEGYPFDVKLWNQADPPDTVAEFTNFFPTYLSGSVNAANWITNGFSTWTTSNTFGYLLISGVFAPMLEDAATGMYHQLFAYNTGYGNVLQISDATYAGPLLQVQPPAGAPFRLYAVGNQIVPQLEDASTGLFHTMSIFNDAGVPELQLSDTGY
jgi:hypothetical protein